MKVGIIGAGTMGSGIAQVAAQFGESTILLDSNNVQLEKAKNDILKSWDKLVEKQKISETLKNEAVRNLSFTSDFTDLKDCEIVIEAIVENLSVKLDVFTKLEEIVSEKCILASNTSSLSIASIGACLKNDNRIIGIHFFNPATLMPLVEIIPSIQTSKETVENAVSLIRNWNKTVVLCKDTPGFIVNRVARPFYGEALRILEEGIASIETIDWAMTEIGGFKMGPFTLMDYIGNDINYTVTETVFEAFYYDPRFKPSFTQKRLKEAKYFGRKSGKGFYDYNNEVRNEPVRNYELGNNIFLRIIAMLINEAYDALFMGVASKEDIELAMIKGVNYPKGLFQWANEIGVHKIYQKLQELYAEYGEDRYRTNVLLKREALSKVNL